MPGKSKSLNFAIGGPFEWYIDDVMRGRFHHYSGEEVSGINLVIFCLYSPNYVEIMKSNSGKGLKSEWLNLLNTYQYELEYEPSRFNGTREENILQAIGLFIEYASILKVPAMTNLVEHVSESIGINSVSKAIAKADAEYEKILNYAQKKPNQCIVFQLKTAYEVLRRPPTKVLCINKI